MHDHVKGSPVTRVGLRFLLVGLPLLVASWWVGNSALMGNGIDNLSDGIYMTSAGLLGKRWERSSDHNLYCRRRGRMRIVSALIAIPLIVLGLFLERGHNQAELIQLVVSLIAACIVIPIAWRGRNKIGHDHDKHNGGIQIHLLVDILAASIAALSSVAAFASGRAGWNFIGGLIVLVLATILGINESVEAHRDIHHLPEEHTHLHETPAVHALHAGPN